MLNRNTINQCKVFIAQCIKSLKQKWHLILILKDNKDKFL